MTYTYCCVYSTPDDGQKTCPKHVEFYSKNKFEKLVHLVGFIIRMLTAAFGYMHCSFNLCRYGKRRWLPHKKSAFAGGRALVELSVIFVAMRPGTDLP